MGALTAYSNIVCRTTGMGFAAVARVTEGRWIARRVNDEIAFGLKPCGELKVETTPNSSASSTWTPISAGSSTTALRLYENIVQSHAAPT